MYILDSTLISLKNNYKYHEVKGTKKDTEPILLNPKIVKSKKLMLLYKAIFRNSSFS